MLQVHFNAIVLLCNSCCHWSRSENQHSYCINPSEHNDNKINICLFECLWTDACVSPQFSPVSDSSVQLEAALAKMTVTQSIRRRCSLLIGDSLRVRSSVPQGSSASSVWGRRAGNASACGLCEMMELVSVLFLMNQDLKSVNNSSDGFYFDLSVVFFKTVMIWKEQIPTLDRLCGSSSRMKIVFTWNVNIYLLCFPLICVVVKSIYTCG